MHLRTRAANPRKFVSWVFRFERTKKCGNFNFTFPFSFKFVGHFNHLVPFEAFWGVFMFNTISFRTALLINFSLSARTLRSVLQFSLLSSTLFFFSPTVSTKFGCFAYRLTIAITISLTSRSCSFTAFLGLSLSFARSTVLYVNASAWAKCRGQASFIDWTPKADAVALASS